MILPAESPELQRLYDRIEELTELLGAGDEDVARLRSVLKLKPQPCQMIGFMLKRMVATRQGLHTVIFGNRPECDQPDIKIIDVQMVHIRAALKKVGITVRIDWGSGSWSLSPADKAKLRGLMAAVDRPVTEDRERVRERRMVFLEGPECSLP